MSARLELVLLAAVASSGCAYMGYRTRVTRGFEPIAKCATGPFEVHTTALGARWGERVALVANTPRRLQGRYEVLVNGKRELTEGFSGQAAFEEHADWSLQLDLPDDRSGCKPSGAQLARGEVGAGGATTEVTTMPQPSAALPTAPDAPPAALEPPWREVPYRSPPGFPLWIVVHTWTNYLDHPPKLKAGDDITLRFWSTDVLDLHDVTFALIHQALQPSVSDDKWIAELRSQKRDLDRRQREADDQERQRREHCAAHHEDRSCWNGLSYEEYHARLSAPRPPPREPEPPREPAPREPDGPPPALLAESQPPQPSVHAEWIPGYWHWDGFHYGWIGGFWRVPDSDLEQRLTVRAPAPPPPPQVEAQTPALRGATWIPGYWQWSGHGYVWVRGAWRVPPPGVLEWQPPRWIVDGNGVRFEPGRWRAR